VNGIYYCPHHPEKGFEGEIPELKIDCDCRKPKAGMLFKAAKEMNIDLANSWMIGDSERDLLAGKNAGCKTTSSRNRGRVYQAIRPKARELSP
jgi:D-glycero-D-manno-heptose 1,7-bisphosphate phosphatase